MFGVTNTNLIMESNRAVADDLIYNSGNTFAIPLFLYKIELGSDIHDIHIDVFHKSSYDGLWNFWKNDASAIEDWDGIFDYDPYFEHYLQDGRTNDG